MVQTLPPLNSIFEIKWSLKICYINNNGEKRGIVQHFGLAPLDLFAPHCVKFILEELWA